MTTVLCLTRTLLVPLISAQCGAVLAQEESKPAKIELGIQFSSMSFTSRSGGASLSGETPVETGIGVRFTLNLNKRIALEAEGNFFPQPRPSTPAGGRVLQGQFGVKAGQRFQHFGVFAKARPGVISFDHTLTFVDIPGQPFSFEYKRRQFLSLDVGGVVEFYPSRRILTRFDIGDTIIRNSPGVAAGAISPFPSTLHFSHNLQVSAGLGLRFLHSSGGGSETRAQSNKVRRFEVGAQFSSLGLNVHEGVSAPGLPVFDFRDTRTQVGFGGRLTYNFTRNLAVEAESNLFPRIAGQFNNARTGGRITQAQFGVKAGKHFSKFGVFAKARPGVVSFSKVPRLDGFSPGPFGTNIDFHYERLFYFSTDAGGVVEFYPSSRLLTRFDAGDTIIRYGHGRLPSLFNGPMIIEVPPETMHNFQFSAGVGFRF